ncbi:MAG: hypothetical protein WBL35_03500 [Ornithinibacter sp.]
MTTEPGARGGEPSEDVQRVTRWEVSGGIWQVLARSDERVTVGLYRCDAGEEVDRFSSSDPALLAHLADRTRSDEA